MNLEAAQPSEFKVFSECGYVNPFILCVSDHVMGRCTAVYEFVGANTTVAPNARYGRKAVARANSPKFRFWLQAVGRRIARSVCFTPSTGLSGSGIARHAILATNVTNVRFLPIASGLPSRADAPGTSGDGRF